MAKRNYRYFYLFLCTVFIMALFVMACNVTVIVVGTYILRTYIHTYIHTVKPLLSGRLGIRGCP